MKKDKTVLLVDDDEDDRLLLSDALTELIENIEVIEMGSGKELLSILLSGETERIIPDLILLDMNMPELNGLEILSKIKEDRSLREIPTVMLSTASHKDLIAQAYRAGVNAFMVKPITASEYEMVASAVNICFLNNLAPGHLDAVFKSHKDSNIVVIEDNDDHWNLLNFSIKQSMPRVNMIRLRDQRGAMEYFESSLKSVDSLPDMILLDLYLPVRDAGLALLEHIRYRIEINKLPPVPIIVLSYSDNREDVKASYARQANSYMIKPLDPNNWPVYFKNLTHFWSKTISLPKQ
ncbi:response regulator [Dyadobacter psychrophilus]|uniref:Response regulator containing a CheY-like receiver domain and a GGDEF domain n=1 Tax=Dyadobacter psychrophilus TaxID=651661 RepID=A0A1T5EQ32_9BACT|nr:response regulator [Dyadobacter psychrophilus]SKB86051.1 Response regulator containing a CheY-like receiver domain and a GGDEF domain [Dyadobacter psychrophilus]